MFENHVHEAKSQFLKSQFFKSQFFRAHWDIVGIVCNNVVAGSLKISSLDTGAHGRYSTTSAMLISCLVKQQYQINQFSFSRQNAKGMNCMRSTGSFCL